MIVDMLYTVIIGVSIRTGDAGKQTSEVQAGWHIQTIPLSFSVYPTPDILNAALIIATHEAIAKSASEYGVVTPAMYFWPTSHSLIVTRNY